MAKKKAKPRIPKKPAGPGPWILREGYGRPYWQRLQRNAAKKKRPAKKRKATKKRSAAGKRNPGTPKLKRVSKSTGWMPAAAVRIVKKRGGEMTVLVRKPGRKRKR